MKRSNSRSMNRASRFTLHVSRKKIISVVGARPNFMKVAPMTREFAKYPDRFKHLIVHTGQHYDEKMSKIFFDELDIPRPDINLEVGSGNHGEQTGKVMIEFEKVCLKENPDLVLVYGDVNSTIAAALVAVKLHIKVGHVEAGLRSFDRTMPEEINRILTDAISNYLFTPSPDADANLTKEGIHNKNIFRVGNIMVDSLLFNKPKAAKSKVLKKMALKSGEYALLTLHRPGNVDNLLNFEKIISVIKLISKDIPVVFPTHPRTKNRLNACGLEALGSGIKITGPLGYLDFIHLMMHCKFVLTDSGGAQEETTVLGVPCLTLRETTERPITVTEGTNTLVAGDNIKISREVAKILHGKSKRGRIPKLWDGKTAQRIIKLLGSFNLNN